jgi:ATP-dependent Lon protease
MSDKAFSGQVVRIPLLPLRDILVFPNAVVPLFVGRDKSIAALEHAMSTSKEIMLAAQKKAKTNDPVEEDIFDVGTISTILQLLRLPDGTVKVLVEGRKRAKILNYCDSEEFFVVEAEELKEQISEDENEALVRTVKSSFENYVRLNKRIPPEMLLSISQIEGEGRLADTLVGHLTNLKLLEKQALLEEANPAKRLEQIYGYIQSEIEIMRVEKKIRARVKRQMEKNQKEYYLNEQMAAIQKELGDREDGKNEIQDFDQQIKEKKLSEEARDKLTKEVKKLKQMSPMSAESAVVRNYLETVLSLPWGEYTKEIRNISYAETVLNRDHYGLDKIKDRILEYLSIRSLSKELKGPILCLVGPPGVGKTSLAKSVADSTGRKFTRIALGGVKDQAEIRGHRKTYIGSMPGKIIMAVKKAASSNPVILLDEVDKISADYRGDPTAALLEVLDPEQNHTFNDHYLDLDYDLSKVLFLATANSLSGIPRPLLDRMEVISLSGYTEDEKLEIAKRYLLPKTMKQNGLEGQKVMITDEAIREILRYYTRESGVRNLERELGTLYRKAARKHLKTFFKDQPGNQINVSDTGEIDIPEDVDFSKFSVEETISEQHIESYLGPRRFRIGVQNEVHEAGLCTGLAWTEVGGELLVTEVAVFTGKGKVTVTGKLGEVMQESAQAAMSYVRSRAAFLDLDPNFYEKNDIHIHLPEGAIPKDGPSAGITMATALTSALTGRLVNKDVAMTGEITLRGRVLAIGGLKEKALAAHRGGIKKILFPKDNEKDLRDIPEAIRKEIEWIPVEHMDQVLFHALVWNQNCEREVQDSLFERLRDITKVEQFDLHH